MSFAPDYVGLVWLSEIFANAAVRTFSGQKGCYCPVCEGGASVGGASETCFEAG